MDVNITFAYIHDSTHDKWVWYHGGNRQYYNINFIGTHSVLQNFGYWVSVIVLIVPYMYMYMLMLYIDVESHTPLIKGCSVFLVVI